MTRRLWTHDFRFDPYWIDAKTFDFAETGHLNENTILPWIWTRRHPLTRQLLVEPRADFLRYHALDVRDVDGTTEYVHPLDDIAVLRVSIESHEYFETSPFVAVYRDHLRDYLRARRAGLLIAVVADRFASAPNEADLGIESAEYQSIGPSAWATTVLHRASDVRNGTPWARSSLYWNIYVPPYDQPKLLRSSWPSYGLSEPVDELGDAPPRFVANAEGLRLHAKDANCPQYLYFRPQVLEHYLNVSGYSVRFHMRNWGGACGPRDTCVDVGINSRGLVTAFAPDIAKLSLHEQQHWAAHTSLPDGEVCRELVQTRMQLAPPRSPNALEVVEEQRVVLNAVFKQRFGAILFRDTPPLERDGQRMTVGPLRGDTRELFDLAKPLYVWAIESMGIEALRGALRRSGAAFDQNDRQIVLLRRVLQAEAHMSESEARQLVAPLTVLNQLRVSSAHVLDRGLGDTFKEIDGGNIPVNIRDAWVRLIDGLARSLETAGMKLRL